MDRLDVERLRLRRVERAAIAGAFQKRDPRCPRITRQVLEREHQRLPHQPVDDEAMLLGIDVRHARMAALVVQPARRDGAVEELVRRARAADARRRRIVGRRPGPRHLALVMRGLPIGGEVSARLLRPARHRERLGQGAGRAHTNAGRARDQRALEENAAVENAVAGRRLGRRASLRLLAMDALLGQGCWFTVPGSVARMRRERNRGHRAVSSCGPRCRPASTARPKSVSRSLGVFAPESS